MTFSTNCDNIIGVMKMFFKSKETIPEGMGFSTFGVTHLIWLLALALFCGGAVIFYRKANAKTRKIARTVLGASVVLLEIIKDIVVIAIGEFSFGYLPFHLCGINVLLIGFDVLKQTKAVRNFLYYFCIPGAMLALIFPNWTVLPCLNFMHIHSFIIHAALVLYPLLLVTSGEVKPNIKDMLKCILLLIGMATPIYFINLACGTNFMFLMDPETGNPLGLFEQLLGSHLWGFLILLPIVMFIMYLPLFIASKCKKEKETLRWEEKQETTV